LSLHEKQLWIADRSSAVHPVMLMLQYQIVQHHQVEAVALIGNSSFTGCGAQL